MKLEEYQTSSTDKYYTETYRPQFHFTPESNWMNDPNGMVYFEGEYHLFYQYHPYDTIWGPMHWGHAVSKDLIHWEHLPIALSPDENGAIFSGSAVVDWNDSTGFFNGGSGLVAIFTHADQYSNSERPRQRQSLAYSNDKGRTWNMYKGNPILSDISITDFRDPKVFWHENTKMWVMILAAGNHVRIYTSHDLKTWNFASEFGSDTGSQAGVWECPDLFELPVDGKNENKKWVMIVSIGNDAAYAEGSRTQYFIGDFDGSTFTNENSKETVHWLDFGRDNYAGVTWSDVPAEDGRRLFIGWMSNWKYANETPTKVWRSAMTLPRELNLVTTIDGVRISQTPITELETLRKENTKFENILINENVANVLSNIKGKAFELRAEFELETASVFGFKVRMSNDEKTIIGYNVTEKKLFIDRQNSGETSFNPFFACKHEAILEPKNNRIKMQIFVDWSSVEVFANNGELVMTDLIFPDCNSQGLELFAVDGNVHLTSLDFYDLKSCWCKK
ncbi:levanase [Neobacillus bataviensis]|uniref:Levanase n=1 Tax=Neobacillus bataviensis TaxID=220685 RepID=A0A561DCX3_9BACI|nr:glycoside hydrolase family 32 protein [Neobacillus bataviensis]TWE01029.1 levanase [Neobacillus bataviensis]